MPALTQFTFHLPDPLAHWPWSRKLNPHYGEVKPESDAWLRSFETLDAKSQRSFDRCNFCKYPYFVFAVPTFNNLEHPQRFSVASHIHLLTKVIFTNPTTLKYLTGVPDRLRVACDLMILFYIFDEFTDKVDGKGASAYAELVMDALRNPQLERPAGESKLGEITRQ